MSLVHLSGWVLEATRNVGRWTDHSRKRRPEMGATPCGDAWETLKKTPGKLKDIVILDSSLFFQQQEVKEKKQNEETMIRVLAACDEEGRSY